MHTCSHTQTYIHTQKLEVHNSGPAVSQVKLVPFMNAVALRLSCTLCVKKGQKSQRPEITEKLVRSSVQSCPPSLKIKFQVKPLLLPSCLLFSQMIVCSHPQKHPPSWLKVCYERVGFHLTPSLSPVLCDLQVIRGQSEVAILAYLIFVMVMTSKPLPAWLVQYRIMKSENLIMVFCT